jgi:hypothetical protein
MRWRSPHRPNYDLDFDRENRSVAKSKQKTTVPVDRRVGQDRRQGTDRRKQNVPVDQDRRQGQRRKVQRRRQIDPTTCERDYTMEEIEFMQALDAYKRANGRMFPTCSEILEVIRDLGYVKPDIDGQYEGPDEPGAESGQGQDEMELELAGDLADGVGDQEEEEPSA